jgi:hypothetical protein
MAHVWYVAAVAAGAAFFGAVSSAAFGWLSPKIPKGVLWVVGMFALVATVVFVVIGAVLGATPTSSSGNSHTEGLSAGCPAGTTDTKPSTGPIANVKVTPINSVEVCVSWTNPDDPMVGGFDILQSQQDVTSNATPSGAPYEDAKATGQLVNVEQFESSTRPAPGEHWKICVIPLGRGLDSSGNYTEFAARMGCSRTFTWP